MEGMTLSMRMVRLEVYVWQDHDLGLEFTWDISAAHALDGYTMDQLGLTNVAPLAEYLRMGVGSVDPERALGDEIDLTVPLIALAIPGTTDGKVVLVDGWHRVYKADKLGVEFLPIVTLTAEQERAIRMSPSDEEIEEARRGHR